MSEPVSQKKRKKEAHQVLYWNLSEQLLARLTGDSKVAAGAMVNG